ncbi:snare-like protein [Melanomma pulvis-pyrius CBS 109.77]|uniref:Snare-like protein n=1 Tax=Melanomma pulvis-pyrius CBS 109.77 TaxID=1314802 RepID=A0A6A6WVM7_9PLEO|nr:snare-like protein [Melanomma pulvis-pyrius CBS 109.77]
MVRVFSLSVWRNDSKPALELCRERDLSNFSRFTQGQYGTFMSFFAGECAERTKPGQRQIVKEQDYHFHLYGRVEGICGVIVTDLKYDELAAQIILGKICDEFLSKYPRSAITKAAKEKRDSPPPLPLPKLKDYLVLYQNPGEANGTMKIQKELDETMVVLHKTMADIVERGEKIDDLVAKSDGLSAQSKMFYTQAKKQNSCCVVM